MSGRDVAPRLDRATQADSDSDALGQVRAELLDAMRDLTVVVASIDAPDEDHQMVQRP